MAVYRKAEVFNGQQKGVGSCAFLDLYNPQVILLLMFGWGRRFGAVCKMRMNIILATVCAAILSTGCAKSASDVTGSYVSPLQFQNYSCQQLGEEAQRISARVAQNSGVQDQKRSNDQVATTAAIILFWPAAFLVSGDDQNTAELARLKGEFESIEKVSIQKSCNLQFRKETAPPAKSTEPKA